MDTQPRLLPVACMVLFLTAGCLSGAPTPADSQPTPSPEPTATRTECVSAPCLSDQPDPDHPVQLMNNWNQTVEFRVQITRTATGAVVYNNSHTLQPNSSQTVYNVAAADPSGVESFTVTVSAVNTTRTTSFDTNECYGNPQASVHDGNLTVITAIC